MSSRPWSAIFSESTQQLLQSKYYGLALFMSRSSKKTEIMVTSTQETSASSSDPRDR